ncbi:DUF5677 domain-containing protein [Paraoerskovia marina]|uniref:DUF5677 domain-containing protein n=1 Tax=Paraoerskovia marina TaxID=545619 RepID=UPI0004924827|nr:DUF5677 domain-containing protein [Paraoerskovia marina]
MFTSEFVFDTATPVPSERDTDGGAATAGAHARPAEAELLAWIEECISDFRDRGEFKVLATHKDELLLLFGVIGRTVRFADGYLKLCELGSMSEGVPLARAALEHAVTVQWVYIMKGGVGRYHRAVIQDRRDHFARLTDWLNDTELLAEVERLERTPEGKRLPPFMNMLRDLDEGKFLETTYHVLSQQVHVTHSAVTAFLGGDDDQVHLKYEQDYPYSYQVTYAVAVACMLVRWILADLTNDDGLIAVLNKKSDALILPMNFIDGVPPDRRRAGL